MTQIPTFGLAITLLLTPISLAIGQTMPSNGVPSGTVVHMGEALPVPSKQFSIADKYFKFDESGYYKPKLPNILAFNPLKKFQDTNYCTEICMEDENKNVICFNVYSGDKMEKFVYRDGGGRKKNLFSPGNKIYEPDWARTFLWHEYSKSGSKFFVNNADTEFVGSNTIVAPISGQDKAEFDDLRCKPLCISSGSGEICTASCWPNAK